MPAATPVTVVLAAPVDVAVAVAGVREIHAIEPAVPPLVIETESEVVAPTRIDGVAGETTTVGRVTVTSAESRTVVEPATYVATMYVVPGPVAPAPVAVADAVVAPVDATVATA